MLTDLTDFDLIRELTFKLDSALLETIAEITGNPNILISESVNSFFKFHLTKRNIYLEDFMLRDKIEISIDIKNRFLAILRGNFACIANSPLRLELLTLYNETLQNNNEILQNNSETLRNNIKTLRNNSGVLQHAIGILENNNKTLQNENEILKQTFNFPFIKNSISYLKIPISYSHSTYSTLAFYSNQGFSATNEFLSVTISEKIPKILSDGSKSLTETEEISTKYYPNYGVALAVVVYAVAIIANN